MNRFFLILGLILTLVSCSNSNESSHPYASFFYPYNEESKFYVYRDVVHGLNEKFDRVYGIEDSYGKHIVVETYSMDGRITEAYNYNVDSLNLMDHMVVDRNGQKNKSILMKDQIFPRSENEKTWFASKFPGPMDSTLILSELKRSMSKATPFVTKVMGEPKNTIMTLDTMRLTMFNPFTKKEKSMSAVYKAYFAEGVGLVRMHDINKKTDYQLEKILSQEEYIKMMRR